MSKIGNYMIEYLNTHPEIDIEDNYNAKQLHRLPTGAGGSFRNKADNSANHSGSCTVTISNLLT